MGKLFKLEIKRICKTKMTLIFFLVAIGISFLLAFSLIQGTRLTDREFNKVYSGIEAIQKSKEIAAGTEGLVSTEKLIAANREYVDIANKYGNGDMNAVPENIYQEKVWPIRPFINLVGEVSNDPKTGFTIDPKDRSEADIANFYANRNDAVKTELSKKALKDNSAGLRSALEINNTVPTPFAYYTYMDWGGATENIILLIFVLVLIATAIAAPIFSSEYQTGSDSILRCTKHGRDKLAIVKTASAMLVSSLIFVICTSIMIAIFCAVFGTEGFKTSIQMQYGALGISPLTIGETLGTTLISSYLTMLAVLCFTLFVSSKSKSPMATLIVALVIILLPSVLRIFGSSNIIQWIRFCLPSGGAGIGNGIYYELVAAPSFLRIGTASIWSPFIIFGASIICLIVFAILTVKSYKKHEVL